MSQNSYPEDNNGYYNETFKQARETSSTTPNVFSQNLGYTAGQSTNYEYGAYNEEDRRDYIREVVNREEYPEDGEENIEIENVAVSTKDLEIFEDKNNHIEELNDNPEIEYCGGNIDNTENTEENLA
jgi:hypothetical protein